MFVTTAACPGGTVIDNQLAIPRPPHPHQHWHRTLRSQCWWGWGIFSYFIWLSVMIPPGQAAMVI
ncbi:hypothetical protein ACFL27_03365 [candidate division CSSED10-310 bacterium]|uniref:Uncharacterized protein n=1 Tax=candidate division CSSED10-310 bacterium TaxID=2855610 RepID=A0ABV6YSR8_UNCC1